MSQEEAIRQAQERDAAAQAAAAAEEEQQRTAMGRSSSSGVPPIPNYQPPPPPTAISPEAEAVVRRAEREAWKSQPDALAEEDVPERILRTSVTSPKHSHGPLATPSERTTVLPILEEAGEGSTVGNRSRNSRISSTMTTDSDLRPLTPAKDGQDMEPGFGNPLVGTYQHVEQRGRGPPPTPPKLGHGYGLSMKPDSADSGYGVGILGGGSNSGLKSATGSQRSSKTTGPISRDSLDKALPPLPRAGEPPAQDVS